MFHMCLSFHMSLSTTVCGWLHNQQIWHMMDVRNKLVKQQRYARNQLLNVPRLKRIFETDKSFS